MEAGRIVDKFDGNLLKNNYQPGMTTLLSVNDALVRQVRWLLIIFAGAGSLLLFLSAVISASGPTWFLNFREPVREQIESSKTRDAEAMWNTWTTRATEWEIRNAVQQQEQDEDPNWSGRQKMRTQRADGAFWWDEGAEQYFISKLESSQFPANCSEAHWIAHYDFVAGIPCS